MNKLISADEAHTQAQRVHDEEPYALANVWRAQLPEQIARAVAAGDMSVPMVHLRFVDRPRLGHLISAVRLIRPELEAAGYRVTMDAPVYAGAPDSTADEKFRFLLTLSW